MNTLQSGGWLANEKQNGADQYTEGSNDAAHSIFTFLSNISSLQEGTYTWNGSSWVCKTCKKLNMIIWFIFQSILTVIFFMIFIINSGYSGGYIGMTPLTMLFALSLQFVISTVLYFSIKKYIGKNMNYLFFIFNIMIYQLSYLLFSRTIPITKFFEEEFTGFIFRSYSLSSFFSTIVIIFIFYLKSRRKY